MTTTQPTNRKFTLKKHERLKSRSTIQSIFNHNKFTRIHPFKVGYTLIPDQESLTLEFGISVPKRHFKSAVSRNKVKRRVREAYRLNRHLLSDNINNKNLKIALMFIYVAVEIESFAEIEVKMKQLLTRLGIQINNEQKL